MHQNRLVGVGRTRKDIRERVTTDVLSMLEPFEVYIVIEKIVDLISGGHDESPKGIYVEFSIREPDEIKTISLDEGPKFDTGGLGRMGCGRSCCSMWKIMGLTLRDGRPSLRALKRSREKTDTKLTEKMETRLTENGDDVQRERGEAV
jgi:hypothetical protein